MTMILGTFKWLISFLFPDKNKTPISIAFEMGVVVGFLFGNRNADCLILPLYFKLSYQPAFICGYFQGIDTGSKWCHV